MAGVRKHPRTNGKYQGWFNDHTGARRFFTGTRSRTETRRLARHLEDQAVKIRAGYVPAPTTAEANAVRLFGEVRAAYLAWGNSQGGRGGRPWGEKHARMRAHLLNWWGEELKLLALRDFERILPRVEAALQKLQRKHLAPKTVQSYAEALQAFCAWCADPRRGYMADHPLRGLATFATPPQSTRRALSRDEVDRLLTLCAPERRLLYETALGSGLRVRELRSLTVADLDVVRGGLNLSPEWTKDRKGGFQPLARELLARLGRESEGKAPSAALLYVGANTSRDMDKDIKAAGIPKNTPEGKVDFHALRVTFITRVVESGANLKEAQTLARHTTAALTMNTYARTRPDRLQGIAEWIAPVGGESPPSCAICVSEENDGKGAQPASGFPIEGYNNGGVVEAAGIEPASQVLSVEASTHIVSLFRSRRVGSV